MTVAPTDLSCFVGIASRVPIVTCQDVSSSPIASLLAESIIDAKPSTIVLDTTLPIASSPADASISDFTDLPYYVGYAASVPIVACLGSFCTARLNLSVC